MIRKLIQEHLVFTKDVYDYYFNDALKNGVLAVENDKGKAKLDMGIYYLNDIPKPNIKNDEVYTILWGLIQKYKAFSYTPHRFRDTPKYYEYEPESKTWEIYNRPSP
ncbi:hypothetical protein [Aquimarina algicola]|uniref:Uncharacterized protein n=1 Tax=Aquimarina algicola TaxID=2589995 RepID=A0A504JH70_9FLAO|nr:hypothetical protein [Aquimarina algicola]TPN87138.1 hypothetical protein FHK87_05975 [Aquimarina algicola]